MTFLDKFLWYYAELNFSYTKAYVFALYFPYNRRPHLT